jgi:hypothetical protein
MMRPYSLLATIALTTAVSAQNWTVGTPVSMQVHEVAVFGGGCYPGVQAVLNLQHTQVTGVTYYYEVTNITNGVYTMVPGPAGILAIGDTIHVPASGISEVYNQQTSGGLEMRVIAGGTPTVAGESHPCTASQFWISNLLLCNEGLSSALSDGCTTVNGSGMSIGEINGGGAWYMANGDQVRITDNSIRSAQVIDAQGRVVSATNTVGGILDLGTEPTGVYVLRAQRASGEVVSQRIVVSR